MKMESGNITENGFIQSQRSDIRSNFTHSPAILTISNDGMILESNEAGEEILEFPKKFPYGIHISRLLPQLGKIDLLEKDGERVNPYLRFLSRIGRSFKVISMRGKQFSGELYFSDINFENRHQIIIMIFPVRLENELY